MSSRLLIVIAVYYVYIMYTTPTLNRTTAAAGQNRRQYCRVIRFDEVCASASARALYPRSVGNTRSGAAYASHRL